MKQRHFLTDLLHFKILFEFGSDFTLGLIFNEKINVIIAKSKTTPAVTYSPICAYTPNELFGIEIFMLGV